MFASTRLPTSVAESPGRRDLAVRVEEVIRQQRDDIRFRARNGGIRTPVQIWWSGKMVFELPFNGRVSLRRLEAHVYEVTGLDPSEQNLMGCGLELKSTQDLHEYVFHADNPCIININASKQKMRSLADRVIAREDNSGKPDSEMWASFQSQDTTGTAGTASSSTRASSVSLARWPWRQCRGFFESVRGRRSRTPSVLSQSRLTRLVNEGICENIQYLPPRRSRVRPFGSGPVHEPTFDGVLEAQGVTSTCLGDSSSFGRLR